jgi:hypothetical protein
LYTRIIFPRWCKFDAKYEDLFEVLRVMYIVRLAAYYQEKEMDIVNVDVEVKDPSDDFQKTAPAGLQGQEGSSIERAFEGATPSAIGVAEGDALSSTSPSDVEIPTLHGHVDSQVPPLQASEGTDVNIGVDQEPQVPDPIPVPPPPAPAPVPVSAPPPKPVPPPPTHGAGTSRVASQKKRFEPVELDSSRSFRISWLTTGVLILCLLGTGTYFFFDELKGVARPVWRSARSAVKNFFADETKKVASAPTSNSKKKPTKKQPDSASQEQVAQEIMPVTPKRIVLATKKTKCRYVPPSKDGKTTEVKSGRCDMPGHAPVILANGTPVCRAFGQPLDDDEKLCE